MRLLLGVLMLMLLPVGPAAAQGGQTQGSQTQGSQAQVVVVGVAGLRWDDVGPQTPVLARLAAEGAVGALSVRALSVRGAEVTCRAAGWLTLGAGARAGDDTGAPCTADLPRDLDQLRQRNLDSRDGAVLGALASQAQVQVEGDGAVLAGGSTGAGPPQVRVVDAGTVGTGVDRADDLARIDAAVGAVVAALPAAADLLVVGLSEPTGATEAHLHVAIALGPSFERGALRSASTRREGYVQLIDVAPTVLSLLDLEVPEVMDGQPWQVSGPAPSVDDLVDLDREARGQREATVPFFVVLLAAPLVVGLLAAWRRRWDVVELAGLAATAALGVSYLAQLIPWWRAGSPLLALLAVVLPVSVLVALAARRLARGPAGPAGLVCGGVAVVVLIDLVTGARLQLGSVGGYSPLVAGRFAGIGNVAFGVLAASALLATAVALRRAVPIAAVAVVVVAVDGAPPWGSDVGGVLALVPAFVLLGLLRTGTRVSVLRLLAAGTTGAAVVTAFAVADWTREAADRTHLGRFVQDVLDGTAGDLLRRKAQSVLELLFTSALTALLPVVVAVAVYLVARPPGPLARAFAAAPQWRHGLIAVGLVSLLGFALNDSGAAVPALALCVALPATAAVTSRARRLRTDPEPL